MSDEEGSLLLPEDPEAFRREAHRALDVALDHVLQRSQRPVWQPLPAEATALDAPLPTEPAGLAAAVAEIEQRVLPYTLGNTHPRFWGWVHGSGTPGGVVAQALIGAINANMGGRDHAPMYIERQVIQWMRELYGFPDTASGLICTGTSAATLLGLAVARFRALGDTVRLAGNGAAPLRAYTSAQAHVSVAKAMELLGLGSGALREVPVRDDLSMDTDALASMLEQDRRAGHQPFAVVSVVGSVNSGAIDSLPAINDLCAEYGAWHHVDGAFGAMIALCPTLRGRLEGIEQADSIAFDFHKWLHVTYAAGCLLVRDGDLHRRTFSTAHAYLRGEQKGAAGGAPWPNDFGVDLSRGFVALGVWMQLKEFGTRRLGAAIARNCEQAAWLGRAVQAQPMLELLTPVNLNIVCLRYVAPGVGAEQLDRLNRHIVIELHCRGIALPSFTEVTGHTAIRVCITNHRTRRSDLQALLDAIPVIASELRARGPEPGAYDTA